MDADTGTYYSVLEVNESASAEELKTAYHGLAREYHPDTLPPELRERRVGKDAEANFKLISEAYKVLSDPEQRALYDEQLQALRAGEAPSAEANPPCPPPAEAEPAYPPPAKTFAIAAQDRDSPAHQPFARRCYFSVYSFQPRSEGSAAGEYESGSQNRI